MSLPSTLIFDWSMYQSRYIGTQPQDEYNPAKWVVDIDWGKLQSAGPAGVLIRVGIGAQLDPCYARYVAGLLAAKIPFGVYHAYIPGVSWQTQSQLVRTNVTYAPALGFWEDLEAGKATYTQVIPLLFDLDGYFYDALTGIYSGGPWLNSDFLPGEQQLLSERRLWIAGYPNYLKPAGWGQGSNHYLHQYTNAYALPGLQRACDASVLNPAWEPPAADLLAATPRGSYMGMHSIVPGQTLAQATTAVSQGVPLPGFIYLNDGAVGVGLQQASPTSWRLLRYYNPALDSIQGLPGYTLAQQLAFCVAYMNHIEQNATDAQIAAAHAILDTNEEDPPELTLGGADSYRKLGDTFCLLIQECERRNAIRRAAGRPEIHLGLLTFAQGVPEYNEMVALIESGLFQLMARYGHWAIFHEGVFKDQPVDLDFGDSIPGSPKLFDAGPYNFRFVFLYAELLARGIPIPLTAIAEFYDGGGYPGDPNEHNRRFGWYDKMLSRLPRAIARRIAFFAGFSCNCDANWLTKSDYNPYYNSPEQAALRKLLRYRVNGMEDDMTTLQDIQKLRDAANSLATQGGSVVASANALLNQINALKPDSSWAAGDTARAMANPLYTYNSPSLDDPHDKRTNVSYLLNVVGVSPDGQWLQVSANPVLWVPVLEVGKA